jgi:hypothetical protein
VRSKTVAAEAFPLWRRQGGSNCSYNGAVCASPQIAAVLGASQHSSGLVLSEGLESLCFPAGPTIDGGFINFNQDLQITRKAIAKNELDPYSPLN